MSYWSLLAEIIAPSSSEPTRNARSTRIWLSPLLNRVPAVHAVLAFIAAAPVKQARDEQLTKSFGRCASVLWPMSVLRATLETLRDAFTAVLDLISGVNESKDKDLRLDGDMIEVCNMIVGSFRQSFANSTNKKKVEHCYNTYHGFARSLCISSFFQPSLLSAYRTGLNVCTL